LVIGDRLDTDIAGAINADLPSLLVLTGVTDVGGLFGAGPQERPSFLSADLGGLWTEHPGVRLEGGWWVCRDARVRVVGAELEYDVSPAPGDELDLVRAAASAVWGAADAGVAVDVGAAVDGISRHSR
jgi:hypothetical protein